MMLPSASATLSQDVNATSVSTKLLTVLAPVPLNADGVPWTVGSAASLHTENGYSPAVDFVADFIGRTRLPVLFVPMAIATPGVVGRFDVSGNTNTSVVSVAVGAYGSLDECDGMVRVNVGGVVGTDQIVIDYSLDGGYSWKTGVRVGTASTYTIPRVGQVLSFAAGSLTAGDVVLTWHSTAPMWDSAGMAAAKVALEAQQLKSRAWYVDGAVTSVALAGYVTTAANAYASDVGRPIVAKCALPDRLPYATLSHDRVSMTGAPNMTFLEVGAGNDTATRSAGSFVTDGFVTGDTVRITGAVAGGGHNNIHGVVTVAASVLTFPAAGDDLDNEGPIAGVSITSEPTLLFALNGGGPDTITRNRGSWLKDGFRVGDVVTITGTASNNVSGTITVVTDSVMTFATGTLGGDETIGAYVTTMVAGQTKAQHLIAMNALMASVSSQDRIDMGYGRARTLSPITGFYLRRNANYFDVIRSFQHDIQVATWKVENGPIDGAIIEDATGTIVEHDERTDSGALAAGFSCLRTWAEKAKGAVYIARSVTRAEPNTVLSATENMYVACLAQALAREEAVNCVGKDLVLNDDGTATAAALSSITDKIDGTLARNLLADRQGEGQRASSASVSLAADDDLRGVDATLNGTVDVKLNGKIAHMDLNVRVH